MKFRATGFLGCLFMLLYLACIAGFWGGVIYVAWHFIKKLW